MTEHTVTVQVAERDLADLEEWARNSERSVADLIQEALKDYLRVTKADYDELDRRSKSRAFTIEEVEAHLVQHRRDLRAQAAE